VVTHSGDVVTISGAAPKPHPGCVVAAVSGSPSAKTVTTAGAARKCSNAAAVRCCERSISSACHAQIRPMEARGSTWHAGGQGFESPHLHRKKSAGLEPIWPRTCGLRRLSGADAPGPDEGLIRLEDAPVALCPTIFAWPCPAVDMVALSQSARRPHTLGGGRGLDERAFTSLRRWGCRRRGSRFSKPSLCVGRNSPSC
jgi:hypothetical protein